MPQAGKTLGLLDVALEFVDELVGAIKLDLRAQEADEFDANLVVVQVDPFFSDAVGLHHTFVEPCFLAEGGFGANGDGGRANGFSPSTSQPA